MSKDSSKKQLGDVSILLAGRAGQGIKTIEKILTKALAYDGLSVFATRRYMSRVRGGMNSTQVRVASGGTRLGAPVDRVDIFVPLTAAAFAHYENRISSSTQIITGDKVIADCDDTMKKCQLAMHVPFAEIAEDVGHRMYANTVVAGALLALFGVAPVVVARVVEEVFVRKGAEIVRKNISAAKQGYKRGEHLGFHHDAGVVLARTDEDDNVLLSGSEAVALGALAGGVDFCSSYPMSPSTGVLTYLAQHGRECGVVMEQATDEIGAVNMAIGAAYAGATPIVTTSGGGFALMCETVSLAAMTETPLTVHIAQRPGPATGLPTQTAQEDLNLVLYAGHGEFARTIYAPGSVAEAFSLAGRALADAQKYQTPTFILTDQFLVDSLTLAPHGELEFAQIDEQIVQTDAKYLRYNLRLAKSDGISPRGVPGGDGLVCADSDEHDESGHITEDNQMRTQMVDKRLRKLRKLATEALMPTWLGLKKAERVLVIWGSTKAAAAEAFAQIDDKDVAVCHFAQVYPINPKVRKLLTDKQITVAEGNATGQFADLLVRELDISIHKKVTRYNGTPFSVEDMGLILNSNY